jgi:chromosome segregation ATPase
VETEHPDAEVAEVDEHSVQAALLASTRAEATLSSLYRAIQQVTAGVSGAREANDQLAAELQRVREMLGASNEQRLSLKSQVLLLEQRLMEVHEESLREREFLLAEQDKFITGLLEEHEGVVNRLVHEREEALARAKASDTLPPRRNTSPGIGEGSNHTPVPGRLSDPGVEAERNIERLMAERERAREVLRRLQAQRDEAQQALTKMTEERDAIQAELARIAPARVAAAKPALSMQDIRRTQPAVPLAVHRTTDPAPPEGAVADGVNPEDRVTAPPDPPSHEAAIVASRPSIPIPRPLSSQEAPTDPPKRPQHTAAPISPPKPPLPRKPDPASRPLGGYSMSGDALGEHDIDTTPAQSVRPPRR